MKRGRRGGGGRGARGGTGGSGGDRNIRQPWRPPWWGMDPLLLPFRDPLREERFQASVGCDSSHFLIAFCGKTGDDGEHCHDAGPRTGSGAELPCSAGSAGVAGWASGGMWAECNLQFAGVISSASWLWGVLPSKYTVSFSVLRASHSLLYSPRSSWRGSTPVSAAGSAHAVIPRAGHLDTLSRLLELGAPPACPTSSSTPPPPPARPRHHRQLGSRQIFHVFCSEDNCGTAKQLFQRPPTWPGLPLNRRAHWLPAVSAPWAPGDSYGPGSRAAAGSGEAVVLPRPASWIACAAENQARARDRGRRNRRSRRVGGRAGGGGGVGSGGGGAGGVAGGGGGCSRSGRRRRSGCRRGGRRRSGCRRGGRRRRRGGGHRGGCVPRQR